MLAGRYELDREIGRGGMGSVWLGHDTVLGRDVAIKQIGMTTGGATPDLERAEREAHLAARINHQNVVAVYDLVDEDGFQWLVMEHVDGPTLAGLIAERGSIDAAELAPIAEQVARALAAAHAHGIVHRDVKPSNVLLTSDGVAKLSDFGIARAQADASLTQTGMVTGSPAYLSPEVASGRTATGASDVWSLGATLFHALSGQPPYAVGDNVLGAMYRIVNEEPPRLDDADPMADLVASMMRHDPEARPSMAAVEHSAASLPRRVVSPPLDLESTQGFAAFTDIQPAPEAMTVAAPPVPETATTSEPAAHVSPAPRPSRMIWVAVGAVAAVVAVVLGLRLAGSDDDRPVADTTGSTSASPSSAPTSDAPTEDATTQALKGFVADYLTTAPNDPDAGFAMLTPDYQEESKGLKGYKGFWGRVSNLDVKQIEADPATLRVSYTYSYDLDGDPRSEAVTLQLEKSGDGFLIAGQI
jgi:serine/threonine protein kinase